MYICIFPTYLIHSACRYLCLTLRNQILTSLFFLFYHSHYFIQAYFSFSPQKCSLHTPYTALFIILLILKIYSKSFQNITKSCMQKMYRKRKSNYFNIVFVIYIREFYLKNFSKFLFKILGNFTQKTSGNFSLKSCEILPLQS